MLLSSLLLLALGYLLGSMPNGYLAGRWLKGIDLRDCGSGSTGATNVLRNVGKGPALRCSCWMWAKERWQCCSPKALD